MISIKTSDIKDFLNRTKGIKQTGILPILSYVELEIADGKATICETNEAIWCLHEVTAESKNKKGEKVLIEKSILAAVASGSSSDLLTLKQTGKDMEISDGVQRLKFKLPETEQYPQFPEKEKSAKTTLLPQAFFSALIQSIPFIGGIDGPYAFAFVNSLGKKKSDMFATDAHSFYHRRFDFDMPNLKLSKDYAQILAMYKECHHHEAGNYDFFDTGNTVYGFIKTEQQGPNYKPIIGAFSSENKFTLNKKPLIAFAEMCVRITPLTYCLFNIKNAIGDDTKLELAFNVDEYGRSNEAEMDVKTNHTIGRINFNAKVLPTLLNTLPSDEVDFYRVSTMHFIKDPGDDALTLIVQGYGDDFVPETKK